MLGIIHLLHAPILIVIPFYSTLNELYIYYFYLIVLLYTYTNGECPISYLYKKNQNPNYIPGQISYPEMAFMGEINARIYFAIMSTLYMFMIVIVYYRTNISFLPLPIVGLYGLSIYGYFPKIQKITQYTVWFTLFYIKGIILKKIWK